mgnify:CR=1 FL=1
MAVLSTARSWFLVLIQAKDLKVLQNNANYLLTCRNTEYYGAWMEDEERIIQTFEITREMKEELTKTAKENHRTVSGQIRFIIEQALASAVLRSDTEGML